MVFADNETATNNLSPHFKWSVTWSTYLVQYGGPGVNNSITMHGAIFAMYVGTTKLKTESFDNIFFIHLNKQYAGVLGSPLKLLNCRRSKVHLTSGLPLRPNRRVFLALNAPSQFFLRESCKAAVWYEH